MILTYRSLRSTIITTLLSGVFAAESGGQVTMSEKVLFEFDTPESVKEWKPIHDTVMGGVSSGGCRWHKDGRLEFSGQVSLENNGGFASVRVATDSLDLSAYDELVIRLRGDGQRYGLSLQTDYGIMAGGYYFSFQTEAEAWQEVRAPLSAFEARSFGRPLSQAPPLNASDLRALGFLISDKQAGPFRLEVDWIKAVQRSERAGPQETDVVQDKARAAAALIQQAIRRGVPLFNAGQPQACADVYELTAHCIVDLAAADLPAEVVQALRSGLAKAEQKTDPAARAWALRHAFDASLPLLEQAGPRPDAPQ